jgi:hypothetical protein
MRAALGPQSRLWPTDKRYRIVPPMETPAAFPALVAIREKLQVLSPRPMQQGECVGFCAIRTGWDSDVKAQKRQERERCAANRGSSISKGGGLWDTVKPGSRSALDFLAGGLRKTKLGHRAASFVRLATIRRNGE